MQNGRRSQSKNLLELKNNLINQKNLLPSKILANQSSDYSPKSSMFKRNLSLPFKQCRQQNFRRTRNESTYEAAHLGKVHSLTHSKITLPANLKGDSLLDCDFSFSNKNAFQYQKNSTIKHNEPSEEIKRAYETNQVLK